MTVQPNTEAVEPTAAPPDPAEVGRYVLDLWDECRRNEQAAIALAEEMDALRERARSIDAEGTRLRDAMRTILTHPSRGILFNRDVL